MQLDIRLRSIDINTKINIDIDNNLDITIDLAIIKSTSTVGGGDLHQHNVDVHQGRHEDPKHASTVQDNSSHLKIINNEKSPTYMTTFQTFMMTVAVNSDSGILSIIQAPT